MSEPEGILNPTVLELDALSERQRRGLELFKASQTYNGLAIAISEDTTVWCSQSNSSKSYRVERELRNRRGRLRVEYTCECGDFKKNGAIDCKHIVAEKFRRGELRVTPPPAKASREATRRPPRRRTSADGRSKRSTQRDAHRSLPERIPELIRSLRRAFDVWEKEVDIPSRGQAYRGGKKAARPSSRAAVLLSKVTNGKSASEMMFHFTRMIEEGILRIGRAPNENTLSKWMNDERLTPVLRKFLRLTSQPFRQREIGAIIDSSKVSQLMTAHQRKIEHDTHDERPNANWAKCSALVGVETLVVMAVELCTVYGEGTHDVNFVQPLVKEGLATFPLEFLLADKAYLSEATLNWLKLNSLRAAIPLKKGWFRQDNRFYREGVMELLEWFDRNDNRDFHEVYRLRPKVETLFSVLKRKAQGYCWSRGRKRESAVGISTAWTNEILCKFIFVNLLVTVDLEKETGVKIDYLIPSRCFPPPDDPLLKSTRAA